MVLQSVAYYQIAGLPVVVVLGIISIILLLITAFLGYASIKGIMGVKFKTHMRFAVITIIFAVAHGLLVFLARL